MLTARPKTIERTGTGRQFPPSLASLSATKFSRPDIYGAHCLAVTDVIQIVILTGFNFREQTQQLANYEKEITMLKEVISSKDEIVMKTTNEVCLNSKLTLFILDSSISCKLFFLVRIISY